MHLFPFHILFKPIFGKSHLFNPINGKPSYFLYDALAFLFFRYKNSEFDFPFFKEIMATNDTFLRNIQNQVEGDSSVVPKRLAFGTPSE